MRYDEVLRFYDILSVQQDVDVDRPRPPALVSLAAQGLLDPLQRLDKLRGREGRADFDDPVDKPVLRRVSDGFRPVQGRPAQHLNVFQRRNLPERTAAVLHRVAEVTADAEI